jgi:hypothetical protein
MKRLTKVTKRPGRATVLSLAVAVPLAVTAGYLAPGIHDAMTLGVSAGSIAHDLGCTDYKQEAQHNALYLHHDSGICTFHNAQVRVITFDHGSDSDSFTQTVRILGLTTNQTGAFASATGWNISDPSYDLAVAQTVAEKLGGSVVTLPAANKTSAAKPASTPHKTPATKTSTTKKQAG